MGPKVIRWFIILYPWSVLDFSPLCMAAVDKNSLMVGSYGPKTEPHEYQTPIEDAPSGMMARGVYTVKSKFTDDDKNIYKEWEWSLKIAKEWEQ